MVEEKLQAERLAVVGQTVAGLAHGIKNLSAALEGGMYMLSSGIEKGDLERVQKGMIMLDRNIQRISTFVKAFLNFAKGRQIKARMNDPAEIAREVIEMYTTKADELGIRLDFKLPGPIPPAPIDYESLYECLTNLVGNAIDACQEVRNGGSRVTLQVYEKRLEEIQQQMVGAGDDDWKARQHAAGQIQTLCDLERFLRANYDAKLPRRLLRHQRQKYTTLGTK